jgi:hypothetical protein
LAAKLTFPGGKRFAFTICDDTDMARIESVAPVYRLLEELGLKAAKSVWPLPNTKEKSVFDPSQTLADPDYCAFIADLRRRGFEITFHGAAMTSSTRAEVLTAFDHYRAAIGEDPRIHTNHAHNRDNLYWGGMRVDDPLLKWLVTRDHLPRDHYLGHVEGSSYFWGDVCAERVRYVRNLTFQGINLRRINPSMPYHDPARPYVRGWFSASEADSIQEFLDLLRSEHQEQLEREGGVCIVATHLGKKFAVNGAVNPEARRLLTELAGRPGWFPNLSELLDYLREARGSDTLPAAEWRAMQWTWMRDVIREKWTARERHRQRRRRARGASRAPVR